MKFSGGFKPKSYRLTIQGSSGSVINWLLEIPGLKLPPPSKRIVLHSKNLRVLEAKIIATHKQKSIEYDVIRINHLKSFEEVRLHTKELLYPGETKIELVFKSNLPPEAYQKLAGLDGQSIRRLPLREYFPSVDTAESKAVAEIKILPQPL